MIDAFPTISNVPLPKQNTRDPLMALLNLPLRHPPNDDITDEVMDDVPAGPGLFEQVLRGEAGNNDRSDARRGLEDPRRSGPSEDGSCLQCPPLLAPDDSPELRVEQSPRDEGLRR